MAITIPTAINLTTQHLLTGGGLPLILMQFVTLLLVTVGVFTPRERTHPNTDKPAYTPPTITSFTIAELQHQLGPARAYSTERSLDDDLLFGEEY